MRNKVHRGGIRQRPVTPARRVLARGVVVAYAAGLAPDGRDGCGA